MRATKILIPLLLCACGGEETLVAVRPQISICPRTDAPVAECDVTIPAGPLGIDFQHPMLIFAVNRGDGLLTVRAVEPLDATISAAPMLPLMIGPGGASAVSVTLTPVALGPGSARLDFISDDPHRPKVTVELSYEGTPKPLPHLELCTETSSCASEATINFGLVRRPRSESRSIAVRNSGDAPLRIDGVQLLEGPSEASELKIVTSTSSGSIPPGGEAPLVLAYQPADAIADRVVFAIRSNDPLAPEARLTVLGAAEANEPPIADARDAATGTTSFSVVAGELVAIDGRASRDPEGDPLAFVWTLSGPIGSRAMLDDPAAGLVTFSPDAAGDYRISLQVADSLGQQSSASVTVQVTYRYALRAAIVWASGGDVDLHFAPAGAAPFSALDCNFQNRTPDHGAIGSTIDDPRLTRDSTRAPGAEEIVITSPAGGTYRVWAHYYDDGGAGAAEVTARIVFNDSGTAAFEDTRVLSGRCDLWEVGDVVFPQQTFTAAAGAVQQLCQ